MRDGPDQLRPKFLSQGKTIRFDPRPGHDPAAPTQPRTREAGLLVLFRCWFATPPRESRRAARHAPRLYVVWLGWWQGEGEEEFFALTARLANISRGGALIHVDHPPPEKHPVWMCLGTPEPDECLAATALEVRRSRRGECSVRVSFDAPCPSRFLEAAVCGHATERTAMRHRRA
jgi:hypothetical protein